TTATKFLKEHHPNPRISRHEVAKAALAARLFFLSGAQPLTHSATMGARPGMAGPQADALTRAYRTHQPGAVLSRALAPRPRNVAAPTFLFAGAIRGGSRTILVWPTIDHPGDHTGFRS